MRGEVEGSRRDGGHRVINLHCPHVNAVATVRGSDSAPENRIDQQGKNEKQKSANEREREREYALLASCHPFLDHNYPVPQSKRSAFSAQYTWSGLLLLVLCECSKCPHTRHIGNLSLR